MSAWRNTYDVWDAIGLQLIVLVLLVFAWVWLYTALRRRRQRNRPMAIRVEPSRIAIRNNFEDTLTLNVVTRRTLP